jgi:hypothetical protein
VSTVKRASPIMTVVLGSPIGFVAGKSMRPGDVVSDPALADAALPAPPGRENCN